jgi:hypothetical protein
MIINCICCLAGLSNVNPDRQDILTKIPCFFVIRGFWLKLSSQLSVAKKGLTRLDKKQLKFSARHSDSEFHNALGEEIQIDLGSHFDENAKRLKDQSVENISLNSNQYGGI